MTNLEKMIYSEEPVARNVLHLLEKQQPEFTWTTVRLPVGWQVVQIKKLAAKPPKPLPVQPSAAVAEVLAKSKAKAPATLTIVVPVDHDTKDWIYFSQPLGTVPWWCIHKGSVLGRVQMDGKNQRLTVKAKAVAKYGLASYVVY